MTISNSKVRISAVIDKSVKEQIERIAQEQERSASFIINKALKEWVESRSK